MVLYYTAAKRTNAKVQLGITVLSAQPMSILLFVVAAVSVLSTASLVMAWKRAVPGYEDQAGFHPGVDPSHPTSTSHDLLGNARKARDPRQVKLEV